MATPITCYRCKNVVIPVVQEITENSGYIGVDIPNTSATVFRPVGKTRYIGACPYCGAQVGNRDADQLNHEQQKKDEFGGLLVLFTFGAIGILLLVLAIMAISGKFGDGS